MPRGRLTPQEPEGLEQIDDLHFHALAVERGRLLREADLAQKAILVQHRERVDDQEERLEDHAQCGHDGEGGGRRARPRQQARSVEDKEEDSGWLESVLRTCSATLAVVYSAVDEQQCNGALQGAACNKTMQYDVM